MNFGGDSIVESGTMRGRDWPCLRQFGVFLENRVGRLHDVLRHIERDDVRVVALSISDTIDCVIVRLIMSNYERAVELLKFGNFTFFECDIIGVELPDDPQPFARLCQCLLQAEVNIHYSYPLLLKSPGKQAIALYVDDIDLGLKTLGEAGHRIITEGQLMQDEEFF
jgi:hypothetical protein